MVSEPKNQMNKALRFEDNDIKIDSKLIHQSIQMGLAEVEKRKLIRSNFGFIGMALIIFVILGAMIVIGFEMLVIWGMVIMGLLTPMILPMMIRQQIKGGVQ